MNKPGPRNRIEIIDRPRSVPAGKIKSLGEELLNYLKQPPTHITLAFVDDAQMQQLNQQYRNKNSTTDVLSFPIQEPGPDNRNYLGDIAVSSIQAQKQARAAGHNLLTEVLQLFAHGILHLCGYDHDADSGEMDELELKLRADIVDRYCS